MKQSASIDNFENLKLVSKTTLFRVWFGWEHRVGAGPPLRQARHEGLIQVKSASK